MTGFFFALLVFAALAAVVTTLESRESRSAGLGDAPPKRAPDPGPRDIHAVGATLGRAPVPSWG